jgi:nitrogen fixation NifU-like protein
MSDEAQEIAFFAQADEDTVRSLLEGSGYAPEAIEYYMTRPGWGNMADATQASQLTGPCGDTMKIYLKLDGDKIDEARIQVMGCPGAVASACAMTQMVKGMTLDEALALKDVDIVRELVDLPDTKAHCVRLSVKTLQKAILEHKGEPLTGSLAEDAKRSQQRGSGSGGCSDSCPISEDSGESQTG